MLYKVILGQDKHDKKKRNSFKLYVYKTKKITRQPNLRHMWQNQNQYDMNIELRVFGLISSRKAK